MAQLPATLKSPAGEYICRSGSWFNASILMSPTTPMTVADGLRPRHIGRRNLSIMRQYVSDMKSVTEQAILSTLEFLWQRMKIVVEPSAAVALAPLFVGDLNVDHSRVGVILSGGNVDIGLSHLNRQT